MISPLIKQLELPSLQQLGLIPTNKDARQAIEFKGGEEEGYKRLHYYFTESKAISTYKETRNELIGSNYSTKFNIFFL